MLEVGKKGETERCGMRGWLSKRRNVQLGNTVVTAVRERGRVVRSHWGGWGDKKKKMQTRTAFC